MYIFNESNTYVHILVYEDKLVRLDTGQQAIIPQEKDAIAKTAVLLLAENRSKKIFVVLYLPAQEFMSVRYHLPGVDKKDVEAALKLQLPALIPGIEEELLLAVSPFEDGSEKIALCLSAARADELFFSFQQQGIFLSCIIPRPFIYLPSAKDCTLSDADTDHITCLVWSSGTLQKWLHIARYDLENHDFQAQWTAEISGQTNVLSYESIPDGKNQGCDISSFSYCFWPGSSKNSTLRTKQKKKKQLVIFVVLSFLVIMTAPYAKVKYHQANMERYINSLRNQTTDISAKRDEVVDHEKAWEPLSHFPHLDVTGILDTLDKTIPKDSWLALFEIKNGWVELEGQSPNPAKLVELLSQNTAFANVAFNRASSVGGKNDNVRFGLRFKLNDIDMENYFNLYFPSQE